ncbi:serine acetyltransferase [bacterium]|nr:serine acetyltransferase [bacterium]
MSSSSDPQPPASFGEIDVVVEALRQIRTAARPPGARAAPARLPSRGVIAHIVAGLSAALFPNRLGAAGDTGGDVDAFVARTLVNALDDLAQQVRLDLRFAADETADEGGLAARAQSIVRALGARLPAIRRCLDGDIDAAFTGDPAARSVDEILACYPGVTAILHHRVAHELHRLGAPLVARIIAEIAHSLTGIDIHPGATIGERFFIDHGTGVVIGETARIGRLYHGVTLGAKSFRVDDEGRIEKGTARHPIVEDDVVIYANATILGRITIGRGSVIGGNVWLTRSIAPGSVISQALARSDRYGDGGGI